MAKRSILLKPGEKFNKLKVIELDHITPRLRKHHWSIERALGYV